MLAPFIDPIPIDVSFSYTLFTLFFTTRDLEINPQFSSLYLLLPDRSIDRNVLFYP